MDWRLFGAGSILPSAVLALSRLRPGPQRGSALLSGVFALHFVMPCATVICSERAPVAPLRLDSRLLAFASRRTNN